MISIEENTKNRRINMRISEEEFSRLKKVSETTGKNRSQVIINGINIQYDIIKGTEATKEE